jgi:HEPN domain-containing protein
MGIGSMVTMDEFSPARCFDGDYHDAKAYHRRALQYLEAKQPASLVFNVASVALERYLVALCDLHGVEPVNHNFISLMKDVQQLVDVPRELNREIRSLDHIFGICFLDNYYHGTPQITDMEKVLRLCNEVQPLFDKEKNVTN